MLRRILHWTLPVVDGGGGDGYDGDDGGGVVLVVREAGRGEWGGWYRI